MPMKLKVQHLMDATLVVTNIIRENRPLPQKGTYRLARLHSKLDREFQIINERRNEMIKAYDHQPMVSNPAYVEGEHDPQLAMIKSDGWSVPDDKLAEFQAAWKEIGDQEIEVDVEPVPLEQLCFANPDVEASITANEFITLGSLVTE